MKGNSKKFFFTLLSVFTLDISAQLEPASLKGYLSAGYTERNAEGYEWGDFLYARLHTLMPKEHNDRYFESGLHHTWYKSDRKNNIEIDPVQAAKDGNDYNTLEGGIGYKPYKSFINYDIPVKFDMAGVAGGFGYIVGGPGSGTPFVRSGRDGWDENSGKYGTAQLSNEMFYPLDGLNVSKDWENTMFGYGYYPLPLTDKKNVTDGLDVVTGDKSWTLFLNLKNFRGPVASIMPYFWSRRTITKPSLTAGLLDNNLMSKTPLSQETQGTLGKRWKSANGDLYFRIIPLTFPVDENMRTVKGTMTMGASQAKWNKLTSWFRNGGATVSTNFEENSQDLNLGDDIAEKLGGGSTWGLRTRYGSVDETIPIDTTSFVKRVINTNDLGAHTLEWFGEHIESVKNTNLISIPKYYVLRSGEKKAQPILAKDIPQESGLLELNSKEDYQQVADSLNQSIRYDYYHNKPISTPVVPNYKVDENAFTNGGEIAKVWNTPGPVLGPFESKLGDGSTAVYYWYKFNEQPSVLNSIMTQQERDEIQKRVELLHTHWSKDDQYIPSPKQFELTSLDAGLLVTPPTGLEVGYVPICVHQQLSTDEMPDFKRIDRRELDDQSELADEETDEETDEVEDSEVVDNQELDEQVEETDAPINDGDYIYLKCASSGKYLNKTSSSTAKCNTSKETALTKLEVIKRGGSYLFRNTTNEQEYLTLQQGVMKQLVWSDHDESVAEQSDSYLFNVEASGDAITLQSVANGMYVSSGHSKYSAKADQSNVTSSNQKFYAVTVGDTEAEGVEAKDTKEVAIEAENFSHSFNGADDQINANASNGAQLAYIKNGAGASYALDISPNSYEMEFRYAAARSSSVQVLIDGKLLQTVLLNQTGGWKKWATATTSVTIPANAKELMLKVTSSNQSWLCNIDYFTFSPISGSDVVDTGEAYTGDLPFKDGDYVYLKCAETSKLLNKTSGASAKCNTSTKNRLTKVKVIENNGVYLFRNTTPEKEYLTLKPVKSGMLIWTDPSDSVAKSDNSYHFKVKRSGDGICLQSVKNGKYISTGHNRYSAKADQHQLVTSIHKFHVIHD